VGWRGGGGGGLAEGEFAEDAAVDGLDVGGCGFGHFGGGCCLVLGVGKVLRAGWRLPICAIGGFGVSCVAES